MVFLVRYRPVECTEKSVKLRGKSHLWTMVDVSRIFRQPTRKRNIWIQRAFRLLKPILVSR